MVAEKTSPQRAQRNTEKKHYALLSVISVSSVVNLFFGRGRRTTLGNREG